MPSETGYGRDITEGKPLEMKPYNAKILVSSENSKPNEKSISIDIDKSKNQYTVKIK